MKSTDSSFDKHQMMPSYFIDHVGAVPSRQLNYPGIPKNLFCYNSGLYDLLKRFLPDNLIHPMYYLTGATAVQHPIPSVA